MIGMSAGLVACLRHEPELAHAARARGIHVVHRQRADHVGAHEPQEHAGGQQAERDRRQHRVGQQVAEDRRIAEPEGVDEVDAGGVVQPGELQLDPDRRPPGHGQPAQADREDQLEQEAGEEHRRRVAEDREDPEDGVGPLVAQVGGEHAERDADDERHDERVERQLEGRGAVAGEEIDDGLVVGERGAEVAGEHLAEVLEVLDDQRPVVAGLLDALLQLIRRQAAAERGGDRVAGGPHEQEHHRDQDEDRREDQQEPDDDEAQQLVAARGLPPLRRLHRAPRRIQDFAQGGALYFEKPVLPEGAAR